MDEQWLPPFFESGERRVSGFCEDDQRDCINFSLKPWTHLNEIKSSSFANVMTLLLSSLGTGKRYLRTFITLLPSFELKPSKMRCGACSETVDVE